MRFDRPDLGNGHLPVGEHLQQERLPLLVGTVALVDQQHRRPVMCNGLQQRPPQQKRLAEDLSLLDLEGKIAMLHHPDVQQLALVVPLV